MKKALIIIDLQNDYFKDGNMELVDIDIVLNNTNKLIKYAREKEYKIYFIQHFSTKESATFFIPNTDGVKLHKDLDIQNDIIIKKNYPNSFRDTVLHQELQKEQIKDLIICGAMTHMCIDTTVRAGFDLGYNINLIEDACATKDLKFKDYTIKSKDVHNSFISALGGVFCKVFSTKEALNI